MDRNFRCAGGEIDLVAYEQDVLCFIEVKARHDATHGYPLEYIDARKIRRVVRAAKAYIEDLPAPWPVMRFDAVGILGDDVELIREAFDAS